LVPIIHYGSGTTAQAAESSVDAKLAEIKSLRARVRAGLRGKDDNYRILERRYMRLRKEHSGNVTRLDAIRKKTKPDALSSNKAFTALVERQQVLGGQIETAEQMEKEYLRTVNSKLRMLESQLEALRNRPTKADKSGDAELEAILNQTRRKASAEKFKAEDDSRIEDMRKAALKAGGLEKKKKKPGLFKRFLKRMAKD
ncbi:MAG: hypothetical protein V3S11_02365, partial [Elusimicrobiota bacterium]